MFTVQTVRLCARVSPSCVCYVLCVHHCEWLMRTSYIHSVTMNFLRVGACSQTAPYAALAVGNMLK